MKDKGWDVTIRADGGVTAEYPNEQADQYRADIEFCNDNSGYRRTPAISEEEAGKLYDHLVEVADCVRGLGYDVPDPPSRQAYIEGLLSNSLPWHPYEGVFVGGPNPAAQRELEEKCPIRDP